MKAMILAAGFGTRLRPWTEKHPKALVPVEGRPMLERVIKQLSVFGFNDLVINTHHFEEQIIDYVNAEIIPEFVSNHAIKRIQISSESDRILDTGGGVCKAVELIGNGPVLVHNVDILSTANLLNLYESHLGNKDDITMLVSDRQSSRKLMFDSDFRLCGWLNRNSGEKIFIGDNDNKVGLSEYAFSGIYILNEKALQTIRRYKEVYDKPVFPIMEFFLSGFGDLKIRGEYANDLEVLDIGKPETLSKASDFIRKYNRII